MRVIAVRTVCPVLCAKWPKGHVGAQLEGFRIHLRQQAGTKTTAGNEKTWKAGSTFHAGNSNMHGPNMPLDFTSSKRAVAPTLPSLQTA